MNKNVVERHLKDYTFSFNKDTKILVISVNGSDNDFVQMDKVRLASLARFLIRVLYSMSIQRRKNDNH